MRNKRFSVQLFNLFLIIGALLIFISEFIPWVSHNFSVFSMFMTNGEIFLIFPAISSLIIIITCIYLAFSLKRNNIMISFIILSALSLMLLFLYQMITDSGNFIFNSVGIYIGIIGFGLVFFGLFLMLIGETTERNNGIS